jgi:hypothetical protein
MRLTAAPTSPLCVTSNGAAKASWPEARKSSTTLSTAVLLRPFTTTRAPACARPRERAAPIPLEDPVTSATAPERANIRWIKSVMEEPKCGPADLSRGARYGSPRRMSSSSDDRPRSEPGDTAEHQPRPTNGILVAMTVMNRTLASRGRLAM